MTNKQKAVSDFTFSQTDMNEVWNNAVERAKNKFFELKEKKKEYKYDVAMVSKQMSYSIATKNEKLIKFFEQNNIGYSNVTEQTITIENILPQIYNENEINFKCQYVEMRCIESFVSVLKEYDIPFYVNVHRIEGEDIKYEWSRV